MRFWNKAMTAFDFQIYDLLNIPIRYSWIIADIRINADWAFPELIQNNTNPNTGFVNYYTKYDNSI